MDGPLLNHTSIIAVIFGVDVLTLGVFQLRDHRIALTVLVLAPGPEPLYP